MEDTEAKPPEIESSSVKDDQQELGETSNPVSVTPPESGMVFNSEKELHDYFNLYAHHIGFGIVKKSVKNGDDGQLKYYALTCSKYGKRRMNVENALNLKPSTKTGCKAKINVKVSNEGSFIISGVYLEHNHQLSPRKSQSSGCKKKVNSYVKKRLGVNDQAGISLNKDVPSLVVETGGYENLLFTVKDPRNYIGRARQFRLGPDDVEALSNYFVRMQKRNSNFFYAIDTDEEGHWRNVFWADARSIAAYESFGDVISFDSTYLTDRYDMPLALFVGVNHHGQTLLFGCSLLSNDDTKSYIWLFSSWLECMSGCHPKAIITNQCKAIQAAVAKVFPHSHHRLCLWHIMRKIPEKLGGLAQYKEVEKILKRAVYESIEVGEFEETWSKMIKEYGLEKNEWLNSLYDERHHWVPVYIKNSFWAGMSISQRSESVDAFFNGYVGSKSSLKQFLEQYDTALKSKIENESKADFASFHSIIPVIFDCYYEKQFQEVYTNDIFRLFQEEMRGMLYCNLVLNEVDESISKHHVKEVFIGKNGKYRRQVTYDVCFNEIEGESKCSCCLFEFKGILCRHLMKVLIEKNVKEVPCQYILDRWRKDIKHRYTLIKNCYDDFQSNEQKLRYDKLCSHFYRVAEIGAISTENYDFFVRTIDEAMDKLMNQSVSKSINLNHANMEPMQEGSEELQQAADGNNRSQTHLNVQAKKKVIQEQKNEESQIDLQPSKKKRVIIHYYAIDMKHICICAEVDLQHAFAGSSEGRNVF
ncbi:hypothetical protein SLEP1_g23644 [Rubroshorea leprosula]|uniref:Protein FAR1-RELATED SEQUENCE n=1 Tax=Rubroshorea leprosula TaxID=152421 RepID=A0AAV5JMB9_9ROSI|nr:hypothetical protein SLEP1_g23644 [Rubroshorea leprosula]